MKTPERQIRAHFDEETITVYQAYNAQIADAALEAQTFVSPPFKMERMTWVKPSFLWMMYRSGFASKENQERVLAIRISRAGWESALEQAVLSRHKEDQHGDHEQWKKKLKESPVRLQWDPEKDLLMRNLPYRSIQIGIKGDAVQQYVNEWIQGIEDMTGLSREIGALVKDNRLNEAEELLPEERVYPVSEGLAERIGAGS